MYSVYISGPYRADTEDQVCKNILDAKREAVRWWKEGFGVFCPHLNSAGMEHEDIHDEQFIEFDLQILKHSDVVIMIGDWPNSTGACREHVKAKELNKILVYRHPLLQYEFYLDRAGVRESTTHCLLSLAARMIKEYLDESQENLSHI